MSSVVCKLKSVIVFIKRVIASHVLVFGQHQKMTTLLQ